MIQRIGLAIVVGVIVFLIVLFLAVVLDLFGLKQLDPLISFLRQWAWLIGVLGGLGSYFTGWSPFNRT
jgi:hypothetical protein